MLYLAVGTALAAGGRFALNQSWECVKPTRVIHAIVLVSVVFVVVLGVMLLPDFSSTAEGPQGRC